MRVAQIQSAATHLRKTQGAPVMDKNRIEGSIKELKGAAKETIGKVVGDVKLESEGKADRAAGKIQNAVGGLSDTVRDAAKKP
jgi:uncharacterized protein YjbJ (UPF0337 family)